MIIFKKSSCSYFLAFVSTISIDQIDIGCHSLGDTLHPTKIRVFLRQVGHPLRDNNWIYHSYYISVGEPFSHCFDVGFESKIFWLDWGADWSSNLTVLGKNTNWWKSPMYVELNFLIMTMFYHIMIIIKIIFIIIVIYVTVWSHTFWSAKCSMVLPAT